MRYNFYFDICALCILVAILGITAIRTWVPTYRNHMFMLMVAAVFLTTVAERSETLLQLRGSDGSTGFFIREMVAGTAYFLMHMFSCVAFLMYVMSLLNIHISERKNLIKVFLPYSIGVVLVIINIYVPILFTYDSDGLYHRGSFIWSIYAIAALYMICGLGMLFRSLGVIRKRTRRVLFCYFGLATIGIVIQMLFPSMLVEEFVNALAISLSCITIQSPSEMIDRELQILNRKAYLTGVSTDVTRGALSSSIFICVDHIQSIGEKIGQDQIAALMKYIVTYLKKFSRYGYLYRYSPQVFVLAMKTVDEAQERRIEEMIATRFASPWEFMGMQVKIEACCFILNSPEHYTRVDELMRIVSILSSQEVHGGREILIPEDVGIEQAMSLRKFSTMVRTAMDEGKVRMCYQPVFSSGNHDIASYDACLMVYDDDTGRYIPGTEHIGDGMGGSQMADTDEYVLRQVCRFVRETREAGEPQKLITVRLSWSEIARPDFKRVEGVHFSSLLFKLQETTLSNLGQQEEEALSWLVSRGAPLIIEGFGMGYADIARLRRIHVNSIVLDHSLLESAMGENEFKALVKGIIDMLHDIRITVIIDRIQSSRELALAEDLGCDYVQGDFLGELQDEDVKLPYPHNRQENVMGRKNGNSI